MNAKKATIGADEALRLAAGATEIIAAKGKKIVRLNVKQDKPDADSLRKMILGPTGNLRAPTLRVGKKLIVGFNADMYDELFR